MCELLVYAQNQTIEDPVQDRLHNRKRGYIINIREDVQPWGKLETLPNFYKIKIPGIPADKAKQFLEPQVIDIAGEMQVYRIKRWQIRSEDLPLAARNKLKSTGALTIKAGDYDGEYDYTWTQVRTYFRNLETGLDDAEDLI